ncbi:hypothetical protein [Georgenia faecalis]|uniref:hypothetical protein n=1 Tax=Georgenia faecalis TaxID=2483799 RepID=UPI000FD7907A|nr:hypothetical protein [Georgenia faecalis]
MVNRPKNIGTAAETAVVRAARTRGFPHADRLTLTGNKDRGDIGLAPGVIVEVKGGQAAKTASDNQIATWLAETEIERGHAGAAVGILVTARPGIGAPNAHRWWAHITLGDLLTTLGAHESLKLAPNLHAPLRMTLGSALALLRAAGYGQAPDSRGVAS